MAADAVRKKVAILGGGVGGMMTAFWLTSTPELRARFEVTVHQMGWRLGGKGASGRNAAVGNRIEEHGLHIWFGFYDNAFFSMRTCFDELGRTAPRKADCPIRTFDEAFAPNPTIGLYEYYRGAWYAHRFDTPERHRLIPHELGRADPPPSIWHIVSNVIEWALDTWRDLHKHAGPAVHHFPAVAVHHFLGLAEHFGVDLGEVDVYVRPRLEAWLNEVGGAVAPFVPAPADTRTPIEHLAELVVAPLVTFKNELWTHVVSTRCDDPDWRVFFTTFDTFVTVIAGLLEEDVLTRGFTSIDGVELSQFLADHGANPFTLELSHSPFLRGWYDAAFAFDCTVDPPQADLAAGTGIHGILRLIGTYKQYIAYKMRAGMGDTIFAPLYEVLSQRGVSFRFFHRADELVLDDGPGGDGGVVAIRLTRQAEVSGDRTYRPTVDIGGLPCWPSEPDWDQLVDGAALRKQAVAFEHGQTAPAAPGIELRRGTDFDLVVLAVPPAAQEELGASLRARSPAYAAMLDSTRSVMTQAAQVWTTTSLARLGAQFGGPAIATSFVEPVDTYCDMSHLLPRETWGTDPPLGVAYLCGVLKDQADQTAADRAVADSILALLRDHGTVLWPGAADTSHAFDWAHLYAPGVGNDARARLGAQYLRANVVPTERYVRTPPGSTVHRLAPDAPATAPPGPDHCPNLYLAGDWTLNGINGGCVEAATTSGMLAARAIGTVPGVAPAAITGEDASWLSRPAP